MALQSCKKKYLITRSHPIGGYEPPPSSGPNLHGMSRAIYIQLYKHKCLNAVDMFAWSFGSQGFITMEILASSS